MRLCTSVKRAVYSLVLCIPWISAQSVCISSCSYFLALQSLDEVQMVEIF